MKIINLGILAHVDAGKTTLTESLLYTSGAIAELGSVDEGTTRTDTMNLERQRGITIQTAVTSFQWEDVKVNIKLPVNFIHQRLKVNLNYAGRFLRLNIQRKGGVLFMCVYIAEHCI